jgi:hypothetical protein
MINEFLGNIGPSRGDGHRRVHLDHVSVDELLPALASDREAVVAILDKVDLPQLVELDQGQADTSVTGKIDAQPALPGFGLAGQEGPVKIMKPADAADNLVDGDLGKAAVEPPSIQLSSFGGSKHNPTERKGRFRWRAGEPAIKSCYLNIGLIHKRGEFRHNLSAIMTHGGMQALQP